MTTNSPLPPDQVPPYPSKEDIEKVFVECNKFNSKPFMDRSKNKEEKK
jgi:hypothetical protein